MSKKKKVFGTAERPRLVVYRSLRNIHAQLVDDTKNIVLLGLMNNTKEISAEVKKAKSKTEAATIIGKLLAEKAKKQKIEQVVFDRNGYIYHGRVKALADGAREGGLKF
jgi:large subunit ribosomal protein L18